MNSPTIAPIVPSPPPTFAALKQQVEEGVRAGTLRLDLSVLAPELAESLKGWLQLVQIQLDALKADINSAEIRVRGAWSLPAIPRRFGRDIVPSVAVEARFRNSGSGVDTTIAISPLRNPLDIVGGDLARVLKLLPLRPADLWITLSTIEEQAGRIAIEGHEVAEALIVKGGGYLMRLEGALLKMVSLAGTVFSLAEGMTNLAFRAELKKDIEIGRLLKLKLQRLMISSADQLTITGSGTLQLFGATLTCAGDLAVTMRSIGFSTDVQPVVKMLDHVFFHGFTLQKSRVSVSGTMEAYSIGLSGRFAISGSQHTGSYEAQYASGNTTPFPDLFQLDAGTITPSDALTVMTGATIRLPDALDRLVVLERVHLYYSTRDDLPTRSGVPSRRGAAMHGDVVLLGYRGYVEVEALENSCRLKLMLNAISLGGVLEIGGSGEATPASYRGTKVKAGAIRLNVDTQRKEAAGSLKIRFLKQASTEVNAILTESALEFEVGISLPKPLGDLKFASALQHERVRMKAKLEAEVGISDFGVHIPRLAGVKGWITIEQGTTSGRVSVDAIIRIAPLSLPLSFDIDVREIENLAKEIERAVEKEIAEALKDAVKWLQAALEGLLKSGVQEIERGLADIGREFGRRFNRTAEDTARALKQAGYTMERALRVLSKNPIEDLMRTFGTAGAYTMDEIVSGVSKLCNQATPEYLAREVGHLLNVGGLRGEPLVKAVAGIAKDVKKAAEALAQIERPVREVAKFLHDSKKTAAQAAEIIGGAFGDLEKEMLKESMKLVGYAEHEVVKVVENLWREGGRFVKNLRDEVQRFWDRWVPSWPKF